MKMTEEARLKSHLYRASGDGLPATLTMPEWRRTLADIAAMRRGPRAPKASADRVYDEGEAFVRGNAGDGWTLYPQRRALPSPAEATAAAAERGR